MEDFRKADPSYPGFKPRTAAAIDKFQRHKNLGLPVHLWPECFVECAASLPLPELDKFEAYLVTPSGPPEGRTLQRNDAVETANANVRKQLIAEAERRNMPAVEEKMDVDDEKMDVDVPAVEDVATSMSGLNVQPDSTSSSSGLNSQGNVHPDYCVIKAG